MSDWVFYAAMANIWLVGSFRAPTLLAQIGSATLGFGWLGLLFVSGWSGK